MDPEISNATRPEIPTGRPLNDRVGVVVRPTQWNRCSADLPPAYKELVDAAQRLGVGLVRLDSNWASIETA